MDEQGSECDGRDLLPEASTLFHPWERLEERAIGKLTLACNKRYEGTRGLALALLELSGGLSSGTPVQEEETLHPTAKFSDFSDENVVHIFVPSVAQLCSDALFLKPTFSFSKVGQRRKESGQKRVCFLAVWGINELFLCAKGKEAIKTPGFGAIEWQ